MRQIFSLILIVFSASLYSQNIVITGQVFDSREPMKGAAVFMDSHNGTITNENGRFVLQIKNIKSKDILKIGFINYFELVFSNLPTETDTIFLNSIPLFYYFPDEMNMSSIFCKRLDFICKWKSWRHDKKEAKRVEPYYINRRKIIESYYFNFQGNKYSINVDKHSIDLKINK
jgi:hypothetical protein